MDIMHTMRTACIAVLFVSAANAGLAQEKKSTPADPLVRITTSLGVIELELYPAKAPKTVENFLHYANSGFYNGTVFHRVIAGFMIQGGGFEPGMRLKPTDPPIDNEADNGLTNVNGSIAMARTGDPHSATAQFFINTVDNIALNHSGKTPQGWGYCVFGKVTQGMDVVKKIEFTRTGRVGRFGDVPLHDVVIARMEQVKAGKAVPQKTEKPAGTQK
jgi:cyclophilin family peptidyl-prolyl cis-trans isomerase